MPFASSAMDGIGGAAGCLSRGLKNGHSSGERRGVACSGGVLHQRHGIRPTRNMSASKCQHLSSQCRQSARVHVRDFGAAGCAGVGGAASGCPYLLSNALRYLPPLSIVPVRIRSHTSPTSRQKAALPCRSMKSRHLDVLGLLSPIASAARLISSSVVIRSRASAEAEPKTESTESEKETEAEADSRAPARGFGSVSVLVLVSLCSVSVSLLSDLSEVITNLSDLSQRR